MIQARRGRGSGRKRAPAGYYTAQEAQERLGMSKAQFHRNVGARGLRIDRYVPPGAKEGFYSKKEIELLVQLREQGLEEHSNKLPPTLFRQATAKDAKGIVDVHTSLGPAWAGASAELLMKWYAVNPSIHHIVLQGNMVVGYISAMPLVADVMEKRLRGQLESKEIRPKDILPFENGQTYDLFIGLAERKKPEDNPKLYAHYGARLVRGFRRFLMEDLYRRGIRIRLLLAHSNEKDGQDLAKIVGFVRQEQTPQDRYPIYILDMEHSDVIWAEQYRALWEKKESIQTPETL